MQMHDTMVLHQISDDSNFFLFEDKVNEKLVVCGLKYRTKGKEKDAKRMSVMLSNIKVNNLVGFSQSRVNQKQEVEFVKIHEVDWRKSKVITEDIHLKNPKRLITEFKDL